MAGTPTDARTDLVAWMTIDEPWTRYRHLLDVAHRGSDEPDVAAARAAMADDERVRSLIIRAEAWPGYALKRHNDAAHPLYALSTLADFGLSRDHGAIAAVCERVMERFDGDQFATLLSLPRFLTKEPDDREDWAWMLCDAPTLLYALLVLGYDEEPSVRAAVASLEDRAADVGWRCGAAASIPRFSGPGRKDDPCPMATTYVLKALAVAPNGPSSDATAAGVAALLDHWEHQRDYKLKMFGIGTDFRKLRYPFVWYDILHITDVLSRFPEARRDPRLAEMIATITGQADDDGRYTAGAMFRSWKGWSFADKRTPSPWLTFLVRRIVHRMERDEGTPTD